MALVEPRLIDSLVRPTYPLPSTVKAINSLDREMESILRNTALSDDDKVRQYQRIMERYLTFHDQYQNAQIPVAPSPAATPPTAAPAKSNRLEDEAILDSVPPTLRRKASLLLHRVKQSDSLGWNSPWMEKPSLTVT